MKLEDNTAPGKVCRWKLIHNDGTVKVTRGHTAFFACQAAGWGLAECAVIELAEDEVPVVETGCKECRLTWNGKCGRENCYKRRLTK